jgi:hypothetical protein
MRLDFDNVGLLWTDIDLFDKLLNQLLISLGFAFNLVLREYDGIIALIGMEP